MSTERRDRNIVIVGPKTFPPVIGGIETHVYEVSRRLARKGFLVKVIVPGLDRDPRKEDIEGVHVARVPAIESRFTLKLSAIPSILRELRKSPRALVHAHDATGGYAAAIAADRRLFVYTMHGIGFTESDWMTPFRQGIRMMQTTALAHARHVFCTDAKAAEVARSVRTQAEILPNGVDSRLFQATLYPRPNEYGDAFVVLIVGRMTRVKGIPVLLDAIRLLPEVERKKMLFAFIGDGPLYQTVKLASNATPEILALGRVDHSAINPYFAHADAFVLPSLSEGMPFSLLEAMAAGLPCIASQVGGITTQIPSDRLMLVPPGSAMHLSDAITRLFDDRALARRLGERAREHVVAHCSWESVVDRIADVYREILGACPAQ